MSEPCIIYPPEVSGDLDALITQLAELLLELAAQEAQAVLESPQQVTLQAA